MAATVPVVAADTPKARLHALLQRMHLPLPSYHTEDLGGEAGERLTGDQPR